MKKKSVLLCTPIICMIGLLPLFSWCSAADDQQLSQVYKKINDDLLAIRKQFQDAGPQIYSVLDHVDKLHSMAKSIHDEQVLLRKKVSEHEREKSSLLASLGSLKKDLSVAHSQLEQAQGQLVLASQVASKTASHSQTAKHERRSRGKKRSNLDDAMAQLPVEQLIGEEIDAAKTELLLQNLTRTSTSDPISPR